VQLQNLIYWENVGEGCGVCDAIFFFEGMCDANCTLGNQMPKLET